MVPQKVKRLTQFFQVEVFNISGTGSWFVYIGEVYEMIEKELGFPYISGTIHPVTGKKGRPWQGSVVHRMILPRMIVNRYTLGWRKASKIDNWNKGVDKVIPIIFALLGEHGHNFDRRGVPPRNSKEHGVYKSWAEFKRHYRQNDLDEYNELKKKYRGAKYGAP